MTIKPLRVVLLYSAGHLGSAIILNRIHAFSDVDIVGVVRAEPATFSRHTLHKRWQQLRRIGLPFAWMLAWQRLLQFVVFYGVAPLFSRQHFMAAWQYAKHKGIPSFETKNINSEASLHFIQTLKPDLIISAYFSQILKKPMLESTPLGALNVHPGFLPDYKGAMNYFWVLKNGEDHAGVSVHWMDEGVDTGALLARKSFLLKPNATQQQVLIKTAFVGARLLKRVLADLNAGKTLTPITLNEPKGSYYPMPEAEEFSQYFRRRRFFRIRDLLHLIRKRKTPHHPSSYPEFSLENSRGIQLL